MRMHILNSRMESSCSQRELPRSTCQLVHCFRSPASRRVLPCLAQRNTRTRASATASSPQETTEVDSAKQKWWQKDTAPNMKDVKTVQELVDQLADAGDRLVIVEYYAPWCNACKALYPKICKIMTDHLEDVLFLKVSFEENKDMCKTLGVKVLPFFQFFRGAEGKVAQFSCSVSKIQKLRDAIIEYSGDTICSLEEFSGLNEYPDVHPGDEHHHPDADKITTLAWH